MLFQSVLDADRLALAFFESLCMLGVGSTVMFLVAWLLTRATRRQSASTHFCVWQTVCCGILGLAVLLSTAPGIPLGWLTASPPADALAADTRELPAPNRVDLGFPSPHRPIELLPPVANQTGFETSPRDNAGTEPPPTAEVTASPTPPVSEWRTSNVSWYGVLVSFWILVAAIQLTLFSRSIWMAGGICRRARVISEPRIGQISMLAGHRVCVSCADSIRVKCSDEVSVPFTLGVLRSSIVLPANYGQWSDETLEMILAHELAHVRRRDVLMHWINRFACCIAWFQPLVWIASRQCVNAREAACDDLVLGSGIAPSRYGTALLQIATALGGRRVELAAGLSMAHPPIHGRLKAILAPDTRRGRASFGTLAGLAFLSLGMAAGFGLARPLSPVVADEKPQNPDARTSERTMVDELSPLSKTESPAQSTLTLPETMKGEVTDRAGRPIVGAKVRIELVEFIANDMQDDEERIVREWSASTNVKGEYRFATRSAEAISGHFCFRIGRVDADGFAQGSGKRQTSVLEVVDGQPLDVAKLRKGRRVVGRIVSPNGEPIANAMIKAAGSCGNPNESWWLESYRVPANGHVVMYVPKDMEVDLLVYAESYAPQRVVLGFDRRDFGKVTLQAGTTVHGRVLTQDGRPLANVVVAMESDDQGNLTGLAFGPQFAAKTDLDGRFRLPAQRGECNIWVTDSVYVTNHPRQTQVSAETQPPTIAPISVALADGPGKREIILQAGPTLTIRGTVRWPDGSGAVNLAVKAGVNNIELANTKTDENGQYAIALPKPAQDVYINVFGAKDDSGQWLMAHGMTALPAKQQSCQFLTFDKLAADADGADWELRAFDQGSSPAREVTRADRELEALHARYREIEQQYLAELERASSPDEQMKVYNELDPRELSADDYLNFEEKHRGTTAALNALQRAMQCAASVGDPKSKAARARVAAVDRLIHHYLQHEEIARCLGTFGGGIVAHRLSA